MPELKIKCPRPSRLLKRKASQLELSADTLEPFTKQQVLSWSIAHSIESWVQRAPRPEERRSRSDSFLFRSNMSRQSSHAHESDSPGAFFRTASAQGRRRIDSRYPPTDLNLEESRPPCPTPAPAPTLTSSALSLASTATDVIAFKPPAPGVTSPNYRDTLARHQIHIDSMGRSIPEDVRSWSSSILERQRTSPGLSEDQIRNTQDVLTQLEPESETATRETLAALPLFPPKFSHPQISEGHDELWNARAIPHTPGHGLPPVSTPKADRYYGYKSTVFDDHEYAVVNHRAVRPYAQPGSTSYWPFFMVEFKAHLVEAPCGPPSTRSPEPGPTA